MGGDSELFVVKINTEGEFIRGQQTQSSSTPPEVKDMQVDDEGNSYVVGYAAEETTFGTDTISPPASNGE